MDCLARSLWLLSEARIKQGGNSVGPRVVLANLEGDQSADSNFYPFQYIKQLKPQGLIEGIKVDCCFEG